MSVEILAIDTDLNEFKVKGAQEQQRTGFSVRPDCGGWL